MLAATSLAVLPGSAVAAAPAPVATATAAKAQLLKTRSFSFAIGANLTKTNVIRLGKRDLVIVDGETARRSQIKAMQAKGAVVLGYLSVGSVESWRGWYSQLKPYRLAPLAGWPGERYTDLSKPGAREALAGKIAPQLLAKALTACFLTTSTSSRRCQRSSTPRWRRSAGSPRPSAKLAVC